MITAATPPIQPSRRSTKNSPAATAPHTQAWSLGKDGSVVRVMSTSVSGRWRRAGFHRLDLRTTAERRTRVMRAAAIVRLSRPRATHHPTRQSTANSTMSYFAYASVGTCSQGVDLAKSFMASKRPLAGGTATG